MLDSRIDNMKHYEDKMLDLHDELKKHRNVTGIEQTKFMTELKKTNTDMGKLSNDFNNHMEAYKSSFMKDEFYKDKNDAWRAGVDKKIESLKSYYDGKIDQINFDLSRRVKIDDMK